MSYIITYKTQHLNEVIQKILATPELTPRLRSFFGSLVRMNAYEESKEQVITALEKDQEAKELFELHGGKLAPIPEDNTSATRVYDRQGDLI